MTVQTGLKISVMFAFFIFISAFDMSIDQTFAQKCGENADTEIVDNIYSKIKADSKLAGQISHINVTSTNKVVKLQGWVDSQKDFEKINKIALETDCVVMVNSNDLANEKPSGEAFRGMCAGETKPCGDICIPVNESCNITGRSN